jgi:RNA polymerase sigma-70 factor (ECF subfamily)
VREPAPAACGDGAATCDARASSLERILRAFVRRRVRDPNDVDDVIQTVFARIYARIGTLERVNRLEAWTFQIARNVIADLYRSRRAPPDAARLGASGEDEGHGADAEVASWLPEFLGRLPPLYRDAVRLSDLEGLKDAEVAERLGLSLTATKSRIRRGRARLKQAILDCCRIDFDARGGIAGYEKRGRR